MKKYTKQEQVTTIATVEVEALILTGGMTITNETGSVTGSAGDAFIVNGDGTYAIVDAGTFASTYTAE